MKTKSSLLFLSILVSMLLGCSNGSSSSLSSSSITTSSQSSSSSSITTSSITTTTSSEPIKEPHLKLDNNNVPQELNERTCFVSDVILEDSSILLTYEQAYEFDEGHVHLQKDGFIKNNEALSGISDISFIINDGSLRFYYGFSYSDINYLDISSSQSIQLDNNYNYFKILALEDTNVISVDIKYNKKGLTDYNYIKAFDSNYNLVDVKECQIGSYIDVDTLIKPGKIYYEDKEINFLGYCVEEDDIVIHQYQMTNEPKNLYSKYEFVQKFSWNHDYINHTYTSFKKGTRAVSEVQAERYGRVEMDFEIINRTCTAADLCFNLKVGPDSYPYEYNDGTTFFAMHMNPTNGGFQLAMCCKDSTYTAGWNVLKSATVGTSKSWQKYWTEYSTNPTKTLKCTMKVEYGSKAINCYINNSLMISYTGAALNYLTDTGVGMRANYQGVITSNFKFTKLVSEENGFSTFEDGTMVSSVANSGAIVPEMGSKYGKFEATATFCTTIANSRTGIMIRSKNDPSKTGWTSNSGYYMHHNVTANANFTLTTIYDGTYGKHPDGTTGNLGICTYASGSTYVGTLDVLENYYNRNAAFYAGNTSYLSLKYGIEITKTAINLYIDDVVILSCSKQASITMFDHLQDAGVALVAGTAGINFSNIGWTSYEE